jgi:glycosyltransferase involved in cell wall biosynthesis
VTERALSICIVNDDHYPSRWTNTQQTIKTASALGGDHTRIEVVLPRMWNVLFRSHDERRQLLDRFYGVNGGFDLTQIPSIPPSRLRIEKAAHGILAPLYASMAGHDVIYSRNVLPLIVGLAAGKHVVFESHRVLRKHYPVTYLAIRRLMSHPRFLGVVTNAAMIADSFVEMGFAPERVANAHNCFDPADLQERLTKSEARARIGIAASDKVVCYSGHIQKRKGIGMIVEMAARSPEVHYLICGGWPEDVAAAKKLARDAGAKNLTFTGWIDVRDLSPYLYASDVLLIPPCSAPLRQHGNTVMPIKTYTYLAIGRPIVAPRQEDVSEVLHDEENCLLTAPDEVDEAVAAVRRLFEDATLAERLGEQAERDSHRYTWQARAQTITTFIRERLAALRA